MNTQYKPLPHTQAGEPLNELKSTIDDMHRYAGSDADRQHAQDMMDLLHRAVNEHAALVAVAEELGLMIRDICACAASLSGDNGPHCVLRARLQWAKEALATLATVRKGAQ